MTWCNVPAHAINCRCDGSPETSAATLVERLRETADLVDRDPDVAPSGLLLEAAARIEQLEDYVREMGETDE